MTAPWDGLPTNPERDGWHWIGRWPWFWSTETQLWWPGGYPVTIYTPDFVSRECDHTYHGPVLSPAEHSALTAEVARLTAALADREAEIAGLREALVRLADVKPIADGGSIFTLEAEARVLFARAALSGAA